MLNSVGLWLTNRHQSNHYNLKSYIYCITTLANSGGPIYFYLKKTLHKNTNNWMNHNPSSRWLVHVQPVAPFTLHACCFPRQCATDSSCPPKILKVVRYCRRYYRSCKLQKLMWHLLLLYTKDFKGCEILLQSTPTNTAKSLYNMPLTPLVHQRF